MPVSQKPRKSNNKPNRPKKERRQTLREGLMAIDIECVTSLGLARNIIVNAASKINDDPELNTEEVIEVSKVLSKDIITFKGRLDNIRSNTPEELRRSNVDHKLIAIEASQEYEMWLEQYRDVVMPNVGKLDTLVRGVKHNDQIERLKEEFDAEVMSDE